MKFSSILASALFCAVSLSSCQSTTLTYQESLPKVDWNEVLHTEQDLQALLPWQRQLIVEQQQMLQAAMKNKQVVLARQALKRLKALNALRVGGGEEVLWQAAAAKVARVQELLQHNPLLRHCTDDSHWKNPPDLMDYVLDSDSIPLLQMLHQQGYLHKMYHDYNFFRACDNISLEQLQFLLEHMEVDVNYTQWSIGTMPMHMACLNPDPLVAMTLVEHGAALDPMAIFIGVRPIHSAAEVGNVVLLNELIRRGAVTANDKDEESLLSAALSGRVNFSMVKFLLDAGADINMAGESSMTPLLSYMENLDLEMEVEVLELLFARGADISLVNDEGNSALHLYLQRDNPDPAVIKTFLDAGASVNRLNLDDEAPWYEYCRNCTAESFSQEIFELLLQAGANCFSKPWQQQVLLKNLPEDMRASDWQYLQQKGLSPKAIALWQDDGSPCQNWNREGVYKEPKRTWTKTWGAAVLRDKFKEKPFEALLEAASYYEKQYLFYEFLHDPKFNSTPAQMNQLFVSLIKQGFTGDYIVQSLLDKGGSLNYKDDEGNGLLHLSADRYSTTEYLLSKGLDINLVNKKGQTPLMLALEKPGKSPNVLFLLKAGAEIPQGHTKKDLIRKRLYLGMSSDWIEYAFDQGVDPRDMNEDSQTLLHFATNLGDIDLVKRALKLAVDVNARDLQGCTALHYLAGNAQNGDVVKIARLLVSAGADINACNEQGESVLLANSFQRNYPLISFLLESGADSNLANKDGETALLELMDYGLPVELLELFVKHKVDLSYKNADGETMLTLAIYNVENFPVLKKLLEFGALQHQSDTLQRCFYEGPNLPVLKLVLEAGLDVNVPIYDGDRALNQVVKENWNYNLIKIFIEHGADLNAIDASGERPLHIALKQKSLCLTQMLLAAGADPQLKNSAGKTAFDIARELKNPALIDLLEESKIH